MSACRPGAGSRTAAATTVEGDNGVSHGVDCATSPRKHATGHLIFVCQSHESGMFSWKSSNNTFLTDTHE